MLGKGGLCHSSGSGYMCLTGTPWLADVPIASCQREWVCRGHKSGDKPCFLLFSSFASLVPSLLLVTATRQQQVMGPGMSPRR